MLILGPSPTVHAHDTTMGGELLGCRDVWRWGSLDVSNARCNNTHQSQYCTTDVVLSYYATTPDAPSILCITFDVAFYLQGKSPPIFYFMENPLLYILLTFYPQTFILALVQKRCHIFLPFVL